MYLLLIPIADVCVPVENLRVVKVNLKVASFCERGRRAGRNKWCGRCVDRVVVDPICWGVDLRGVLRLLLSVLIFCAIFADTPFISRNVVFPVSWGIRFDFHALNNVCAASQIDVP